jgi:hypothetical protein
MYPPSLLALQPIIQNKKPLLLGYSTNTRFATSRPSPPPPPQKMMIACKQQVLQQQIIAVQELLLLQEDLLLLLLLVVLVLVLLLEEARVEASFGAVLFCVSSICSSLSLTCWTLSLTRRRLWQMCKEDQDDQKQGTKHTPRRSLSLCDLFLSLCVTVASD